MDLYLARELLDSVSTAKMNPSVLITSVVVAAIGVFVVFVIFKRFRSNQENKEPDPSSPSPSSSAPPSLVPPSYLSSSPVHSSSLSHNTTHDVFPSFRGEDVSISFLSHIVKEFKRNGIRPFIDNDIKRGEGIGHQLIRAIRGSKMAIVVLSRNYASSRWCLDELVEIMKCREELGQTAFVIFYGVDPSDVRKLTGDFGKLFKKTCAGRSKEEVEKWSRALANAAALAGYHSINWENEAGMIEEIVKDISKKLTSTSSPPRNWDDMIEEISNDVSGELIGSSSPFSPIPSSSSQNWRYDVFPSFCGDDVRKDFLSHVKDKFQGKGITPFIDNGIRRGKDLGPELESAIRGSKIAIVVLSKNYASSDWCLNELVEILNCRKSLGQIVLTIFYKVAPSEMKKQNGHFRKVFKQTCAGQPKEDIMRWTRALEETATIAGYHSDSDMWVDEAAMIAKIATDVSRELIMSVPSSDFDGFVGMRAHMKKMGELVCLGSDEVRMIGIWGTSGIGKSTIARVLFLEYSPYFQLRVFMDNVKKTYPKPYNDEYSAKLQLQQDFLSQIMNQEDIKIHHLGVVEDRLKYKRVLAVLDDVDHLLQLDALAKKTQWFGSGSRIIITTQDKGVLTKHGIKHIYKVDLPEDDEALQIVCKYAFDQHIPKDGYKDLAWEVTQRVGNHPLGLKVTGTYFRGLSISDWEKALPRLQATLDGEIESILKFSYDALCYEDKELFIHIACFFNNERTERVEALLADSFFDVRYGLRILAEKSLISIEGLNAMSTIRMHDLLARLGREIVRKQSVPDQRKFLVDGKETCQVLSNHHYTQGNIHAIGIRCKYSEVEAELQKNDKVFEKMSYLQFLSVSDTHPKAHLQQNQKYLPRTLRLLDWDGFPMTCLPCNFNPEFLVEIYMPDSKLEKLWKENQTIGKLKWMNLSGSVNLKELPDLSTATSLERLCLDGCTSLVKLPPSIGHAQKLRSLTLKRCSKLESLPININMESLEELDLTDCSLLKTFPEISTNIRELSLNGTAIEEIPSSIRSWSYLYHFVMSYCESLGESPNAFDLITELHVRNKSVQELAPWIKEMSRLEKLVISGCTKLILLPQLPDSISSIEAENCESLERLHPSFQKTKDVNANFGNCFKLNQEAKDLITKTCGSVILPGEKVPNYFLWRAAGSSLSTKWNGMDTHDHDMSRMSFVGCVLLVDKGDAEVGEEKTLDVSYSIKDKQDGTSVRRKSGILWERFALKNEHLYRFKIEKEVTLRELVFEFEVKDEKWEIRECGLSCD